MGSTAANPENPSKNRQMRRFWIAAFVLGVILVIVPKIPLGVPGEWVWGRHRLPADIVEFLDRAMLPLISGVLLFAVSAAGMRRATGTKPVRELFWLLMLMAAGGFWFFSVQQAAPSPHRDLKPLWVNYDRSSSGYFLEAAFEISSAKDFLRGYEQRTSEGDYLHFGTHPPGLFLLSAAALTATESSPALMEVVDATCPELTRTLFRQLESEVHLRRTLSASEFSALQLVALCSMMAPIAALIPLYFLMRMLSGTRAAWLVCSLFLTAPSPAIFFPKSDVIYPFSATMILWLGVASIEARRWPVRCLAAISCALILFLALVTTLAHLPVLFVGVLYAAFRNVRQSRSQWTTTAVSLALMLLTFAILILSWHQWTSCWLPTVWQLNLRNHARFYDHTTRTTSLWLGVNLLELALSLGMPLFLSAAVNGIHSIRELCVDLFRHRRVPATVNCLIAACWLTWSILWLSGKNSGEAARLWCFLLPWITISVPETPDWKWLLALQLLGAFVTVGCVNGFSF